MNNMYVKKISEYIEENYNKDISLVQVANYIGFSSFYLSKLIKESLEINYVTYVTTIRIEKAKQLLIENQLNISEVAYEVGYSEPKYFSNVFKKMVGMTPSSYRKQQRNDDRVFDVVV